MRDLQDILEGNEPEEIVPEETPETPEEPKAEEETPEEEPNDEAPPTEAEPTGKEEVSVPETEKMIPIASYMAEKQKRQEAEKKLEEAKPDFFEDPEGALEKQNETIDTKLTDMKVNMSWELAKTTHEDFDEVVTPETWTELLQSNPTLQEQAFNSTNPALFAYQQCQHHNLMKDIGDPAAYKERVEKEIREKIEAEAAAKEEAAKAEKARQNIPESLASMPSATTKPPEYSGPPPLEEIIK